MSLLAAFLYVCVFCHIVFSCDDVLCVFFFFQAEDGIRDHCVTGVQTCALPISERRSGDCARKAVELTPGQLSWGKLNRLPCTIAGSTLCIFDGSGLRSTLPACPTLTPHIRRSEERRVGKECRSRRPPSHSIRRE